MAAARISNWARMALPKVSAVMPVPSETKNTVRVLHGRRVIRGVRFLQAPARAWSLQSLPFTIPRHSVHGLQPQQQSRRPCQYRDAPARGGASGPRPGFNFWSFPMSATFSARPPWSYRFENLGMTDVEAVGGKNASLGEMISSCRRAFACRPALPPRPMPSGSFWPTTAWPTRSTPDCPRWTPRTCGRWPRPVRNPRHGRSPAVSVGSGKGHP